MDTPRISIQDQQSGDTPTEESLANVIKKAHQLGLRVMLKPLVDVRTGNSRTEIAPSEKWFQNYETFILKYAELAQKEGAELFSIGAELEKTTLKKWSDKWRNLIKKIKEIYKGKMLYSANWTEYQQVQFWKDLDLVGIDAYFPLSDKENPSQEELIKKWEAIASEMENWLKETELLDKGILFSEIGYPSSKGSAKTPWKISSDQIDFQSQKENYQAFLKVLSEKNWFKGYYIWNYMPHKTWNPKGFSIREKPAEDLFKE